MANTLTTEQILNRAVSLEAYFAKGLQEATSLRRMLERAGKPAPAPKRGLKPEDKARLSSGLMKTVLKKVQK